MRQKLILMAALAAMMIALTSPASAEILQVTLRSGAATLTATDGGGGDVNANDDYVTVIGAVGQWSVNVTTGHRGIVSLDLNSVDTKSNGSPAQDLEIELTATGFTRSVPGTLLAHIGGTTIEPWLTYVVYFDANNDPGARTTLVGTYSLTNAGAPLTDSFAGDFAGGPAPGGEPFSITQVVTISGKYVGDTSFNAAVSVPEPVAATLLGCFLVSAFGFLRWKTRNE
jgi:hypothetical protein